MIPDPVFQAGVVLALVLWLLPTVAITAITGRAAHPSWLLWPLVVLDALLLVLAFLLGWFVAMAFGWLAPAKDRSA